MSNLLADPSLQPAASLLLVVLIPGTALWLAAAWWAYADLCRRVDSELVCLLGPAWILLSTPVLLPLALGTYLLVRPQATLAERRARVLFQGLAPTFVEQAACQSCGTRADPDWRRCPTCAAWRLEPCPACERWSGVELAVCPFCATERVRRQGPASESAVAAAAGASPAAITVGTPEAGGPDRKRPANHEARAPRHSRRVGVGPGPGLARIGR
jgi:hypothetical protein